MSCTTTKPHWMKRNGVWFKFDNREHRDQFIGQLRAGHGLRVTNSPWMFNIGKGNACKRFVRKGYMYLIERGLI